MDDEPNLDQHDMSRRKLLKVAGVGAGALALGGGGAITLQNVLSPTSADAASTFIKGADVSWLPQMEAHGYKFFNSSGVPQDVLTILKGYGINAIRLRTFVNPSSSPTSGHCSITETAAMAVRCKNAGLSVNIDFMFGDTWNSVGVQNPPAAWAKMTYSQMLTAMTNYVRNSMNALKASGVTPGWVQIGNEINSGICHPIGSIAHPAQMTGLLNAAYSMVKAVFPSTPVLIHLAQPQKLTVIETFLNAYKSNGGKWDITAFSSYGSGGAIPGIVANMGTVKSKYGKPIIQVEFGGPVGQPAKVEADLVTYIKGLKAIGGLGLFYWEPEGYAPFVNYTLGAWNSTTKRPTAALNGFLNA